MTLEERQKLLESICRDIMAKPLTFPLDIRGNSGPGMWGGRIITPAIPAQVIQFKPSRGNRRLPLSTKVIPFK